MNKVTYALLRNKFVRKLFNPHYRTETNLQTGTVCLSLSSLNQLGDMIMLNFISQQMEKHGYRLVYAMTERFLTKYRVFFENHCLVKDWIVTPNRLSFWSKLRLMSEIRKKRIDVVFKDSKPYVDIIYFYLAGVPLVCGVPEKPSDFCIGARFVRDLQTHYTGLPFAVINFLRGTNDKYTHDVTPFFPLKKMKTSPIEKRPGISLVIHAGGGNYWNRKWPLDKYLEVCTLFLENYEGQVIFIGGKEEYTRNENIKNILINEYNAEGRVSNRCGTDLNTTANIIYSADLFMGNDSGPSHIAVGMNKRVIVIFGPSMVYGVNPTRFDRRNITINLDVPCLGCNNSTCRQPAEKQYMCLNELPVSMVWDRLQLAIEQFQYV